MTQNISVSDHRKMELFSPLLDRIVKVELYLPPNFDPSIKVPILLVNDGQDFQRMNFHRILNDLYRTRSIRSVVIAGIHAGDRLHEYGTAEELDYMRRGSKAGAYTQFISEQLLPEIRRYLSVDVFESRGFAGFSLGGLSALDMVWHYPHVFNICGVFSGSLWWRKEQFNPHFPDDYRIIHELIERGGFRRGLRFWFQCGTEDETEDRNNNGIIDSIDDTLDLVRILQEKGYREGLDVYYHEIEGGRHDVYTWGQAFPVFLKWAYPGY
jgi:enterochelin esterase-like enzyme